MTIENLNIRKEQSADIPLFSDITKAAFENMETSNQNEHLVIDALRDADALTISLVAELDGNIPKGTVKFHESFNANE